MTHRVFVYGTLMRGFRNHRLLEDSKFLGECKIIGPYKMMAMGMIPAVSEDETVVNALAGELYEVDDIALKSLDYLEGHPNLYERRKTPEGHWMYFWNGMAEGPEIRNADYRTYYRDTCLQFGREIP